jgi:hypothetical protein
MPLIANTRHLALACAGFAALMLSGCVTWRESPQGAAPMKLEKPQKVELSVRGGALTNPNGIAMLIGQQFVAAGYEPTLVSYDAPATGPTVARVDVSAGLEMHGRWTAMLSGLFATLVPAYVKNTTVVDGTVAVGEVKRPYHNQGSAKIVIWLPLILAAPFQQSESAQIDAYFADVGKDLVRAVQALPTAAPAPAAP